MLTFAEKQARWDGWPKRAVISEARHPSLLKALKDGKLKIDDSGEIYGVAGDGIEVAVGSVDLLSSAEAYISAHPNPKDW